MAVALLLAISLSAALFLMHERAKVYHVPILMYHKIGTQAESPWWVSAEDFEEHLTGLRDAGYVGILPSDLAAHIRWGKPLPAKPVIITFDDGFLNCQETAEPLLKKHGFRAVEYLITGRLSESPETRQSFEDTPVLSWPEVRAMRQRGTVVFGSHTRSHLNLAAAKDPWEDIRGSFRDIQKKGGFRPEGFCYPYGEYRAPTLPLVAKAGFSTAMTCVEEVARVAPGTRLLELPRVSVMGGMHRGHVSATTAANRQTVVLQVWKEGRPLLVRTRLAWPGPARQVSEATSALLVGGTPVTETCVLSPSQHSRDAVLELWDPALVIRYAHYPLSTLESRAP